MMNWLLLVVAVLSVAQGVSCVCSPEPEYLGCYFDEANRMISDKIKRLENDMTRAWCFDYCREDCYRYAGIQAGDACLCGNAINTTNYPKKPESECTTKCSGNSSEICGGYWRNSLYKLY